LNFRVCQEGRRQKWVVRLDGVIYGGYLGREDAILDAIEAAKDVREQGGYAEVWDDAVGARVY
jgi:hypothetical protein